jgi:hypothetical protein
MWYISETIAIDCNTTNIDKAITRLKANYIAVMNLYYLSFIYSSRELGDK